MPQITVSVTEKLIDESVKKELKALNAKIVRLTNQVDKLKRQIFEDKEAVLTAERIITAVKDAGGFDDCD